MEDLFIHVLDLYVKKSVKLTLDICFSEFFELLNRVQCDRLDNQRCSHPTVLKNLSLGRRNDSVKVQSASLI